MFLFMFLSVPLLFSCFSNDTTPSSIYTLSLHDALPISLKNNACGATDGRAAPSAWARDKNSSVMEIRVRSEEHTSELQSRGHLVCRLLLEKKKRVTTVERHIHVHNDKITQLKKLRLLEQ